MRKSKVTESVLKICVLQSGGAGLLLPRSGVGQVAVCQRFRNHGKVFDNSVEHYHLHIYWNVRLKHIVLKINNGT